jgi:hypothetical protein
MRRTLGGLFLILILAGCSNGPVPTPTPTPTAVPTKSYSDRLFHFSFRYPGNWTAPKSGVAESGSAGTNAYDVHLQIPNSQADVRVVVSGRVTPFPSFADGHIAPDPNGGADKFQYFHATVSGFPAMSVYRIAGKHVDGIDTFINVGHKAFAVRMVTASPPFTDEIRKGYTTIVRSLQLPFS